MIETGGKLRGYYTNEVKAGEYLRKRAQDHLGVGWSQKVGSSRSMTA